MASDLQSIFTLALGAVRVDRGRRKTVVEEKVIDEVRSLLGLDEYQCARGRHGDQEIVKSLLFGVTLYPNDLFKVSEV